MMAKVELIYTGDKAKALGQIRSWFGQFGRAPTVLAACPGGYVRSMYFACFIEREGYGICHPANLEARGEDVAYKGVCSKRLRFDIVDGQILPNTFDGSNRVAVNAVVLCDSPRDEMRIFNKELVEQVNGEAPILYLEGEEGHFLYLCNKL